MQMPVRLKRTRAFCCEQNQTKKPISSRRARATHACRGEPFRVQRRDKARAGECTPHSTARRRLLILRFWAILRAEGSSGCLASYFNSICCLTPFKATFFFCKISSCFMNCVLVLVNISSWSNILHHTLKVCACLDWHIPHLHDIYLKTWQPSQQPWWTLSPPHRYDIV